MRTEKEQIIDELQEQAPVLARLKQQESPVVLPAGFLDDVQKKVLAEVPPKDHSARVIPLRRTRWRRLAGVAAAAVLLMVAFFVWPPASEPALDAQVLLEDLEIEEMLAYLGEYVEGDELQSLSTWYSEESDQTLFPEEILPESEAELYENDFLLEAELEELESFDLY